MMAIKVPAWLSVLASFAMFAASQMTSFSQDAHSIPSGSSAETTKLVGTTVLSGSNDNIISTKHPASPQPQTAFSPSSASTASLPNQAWDTSVLCKHLANITGQKTFDAAENAVEEPIEAKCFPGFVCVNGACTGGMSCKCFHGWAGLFCQAPCPTDCAPGGTCVTSTSNQAICVCNETSKYTPGVGCVEKPPDFFTTTTSAPPVTPGNLRPQAERECFGAFTCIYGYCQFSTLQCACDPGWKGQLCDQPCELNCSGHGRCHENDEFALSCVCEPSYTGEFCEIALKKLTSLQNSSQAGNDEVDTSGWYDTSTSRKVKPSSAAPNVDNSTSVGNISSDGSDNKTTLRPISERECKPGFVCKNGYCMKGQRSCECDQGWGGELCDMTCDLQCENDGICVVTDGEPQYCHCQAGYAGKKCELKEPDRQAVKPGGSPPVEDPWKELAHHNGQLPPIHQRVCQAGVVCAYGVCSHHGDGNAECICDPRFTDIFCQTPCPLSCENHRHCEFNAENKTPECFCDSGYSGSNCTLEMTDQEDASTSTIVAAAVAGGLVLFLLLLCLLLSFVLYRKRNIAMMAVAYWFQRYEDDDKSDYDAFVFYASADQDRQFVIQTLVPKLEGRMCFTLCIHQRNVVPGIPTYSNIAELIRRSRRIILIISPSFNKDWDKNDYLAALPEIVKGKHKTLPIVLGEMNVIKDSIDSPLDNILKSSTLLKYPDINASKQNYDAFWKRLELSMPKKRSNTLEAGKGQSCLISPSTVSQLEPSPDPKAPMEIRLFTNGNLKTQLLQRIVRVPASKLEADIGSTDGCPLDRILGRSRSSESDSQERNLVASAVDPYRRLRHSESTTPEDAPEGIPNGGFNNQETGNVDAELNDGLLVGNGRSPYSHDVLW